MTLSAAQPTQAVSFISLSHGTQRGGLIKSTVTQGLEVCLIYMQCFIHKTRGITSIFLPINIRVYPHTHTVPRILATTKLNMLIMALNTALKWVKFNYLFIYTVVYFYCAWRSNMLFFIYVILYDKSGFVGNWSKQLHRFNIVRGF